MDVGGILRRSPWGLTVMALLGLSGCVPASRGWVREQLTPVRVQVAEVRDRVALVEEQFGDLDPKVDRILAQMERRWQPSVVPHQRPAETRVTPPPPSPSTTPGNPSVGASLDFTVTGRATHLAGGTTPPDCLLKTLTGEPCPGRTTAWSPAPVKALKPTTPDRAAPPDCLLKALKGEAC
jgi:hypothetical protein